MVAVMRRTAHRNQTIADTGEFEFLSKLLPQLPVRRGTIVGPGQDCAVIRGAGRRMLLTIDALVEGTHFRHGWMSPTQIGRKSFLVNASDIAAMGGVPCFCVVSVNVPPACATRDLSALQTGIVAAAGECRASVVGGNLTRADQLSISIALLGDTPKRIVTRQGARPGDRIYVTGTLGDAALGLRSLRTLRTHRAAAEPIQRFREPRPRLRAGRFLVESGIVSAMIDVSDGLLQDLEHICEQSRVGAVVHTATIPLSAAYRALMPDDDRLALCGGEDYELLCTVPERQVKNLERQRGRLGCPITCIGEVVAGRGVRLRDAAGKRRRVAFGGYDHFRMGATP